MANVISKDGTKITYSKTGAGPALILVLGALNKRGSGKKLADLLKDSFSVITYDRRGRGDSGDTLPYTVEKEVEDLEEIIDAVGGSAYLYGHSSGSILCLITAEKLGKKVTGLAVYEVPYNSDVIARKVAAQYKSKLLSALENDKYDEAVSLFVTSVGVSEKQINAMKHLPMWKGLTAMAPTLRFDTVELMERYPTLKTKTIAVPVLVMYGTASPEFMKQTAEGLSRTLLHGTLQPLQDQRHDVKPAALAPVLKEFFK